MTIDDAIQALQSFYGFMDGLGISPGLLIGLAALLALAGLLAVREAAAWFFKIDELRRNIDRLCDAASRLESEVRVVRDLVKTSRETGAGEPASSGALDNAPDSILDGIFNGAGPGPAVDAPADAPNIPSAAPGLAAGGDDTRGPNWLKERSPSPPSFPISH